MELKVKLLVFLPVILLFMEFSTSLGWRPFPPKKSRVINKAKCRVVMSSSRLPRLRFSIRSRFIRGPICVRLTESQLLERLKDIGGYNPRYVAINAKEAKKFNNLLGDVKPVTVKRPVKWDESSHYSNHSNVRRLIHQEDMLEREEESSGPNLPAQPGDTAIQQCFDGGSAVEGTGFARLCTECSAITRLDADVFPTFINEVICGENSQLCSPTIGACQQRVLRFDALRFTGNFVRNAQQSALFGFEVFVEEREDIVQDIRSCCECRRFSLRK